MVATLPLMPASDQASVDAINTKLTSIGPGGCTGIGSAIIAANQLFDPTSTNRRGIVLLTDGIENEAPCLLNDGQGTATVRHDLQLLVGRSGLAASTFSRP